MIVVNGTIQSDPESIEALKAAVAAMEAATRLEDGCEDYTFSVELSDPSKLRITERWRGQEALEAHMASPHMADFQKAMGAHPPKGLNIVFYEASEIQMSPR